MGVADFYAEDIKISKQTKISNSSVDTEPNICGDQHQHNT